MIEALRGLGYSTSTALADIIDNSISASARSVNVEFTWDGDDSLITVLDDGDGMDEQELDRAMRLGERNPLDDRSPTTSDGSGSALKRRHSPNAAA
jgi:signal transduction histidine kinase